MPDTSTPRHPATHLDAIRARLHEILPELEKRYAVASLEIFGSRVRGDAEPGSDLDLLVTFHRTPDLLDLIAAENRISDHLGMPVDLVLRRSLKPRFRERILAEAVSV